VFGAILEQKDLVIFDNDLSLNAAQAFVAQAYGQIEKNVWAVRHGLSLGKESVELCWS